MKNTSIIEEVRITGGNETLEAQREIYPIEGGTPPKIQRNVRYKNLETQETYRCLSGGLSWPGTRPGYAVILAVPDFEEGEEHKYKTIFEFEEKHLPSFLKRLHRAYQKYTKSCGMIPFYWYGDNENPIERDGYANKHNEGIRRSDPDYQFFLVPPPYLDESKRFEMYVSEILTLSHKSEKRLSLGSCNIIARYVDKLDTLEAHEGKIEDYPAISALGFAITGSEERMLWEDDQSKIESVDPDMSDDEAAIIQYGIEEQRSWGLGSEESYDDIYDDGWVNTVD